MTLMKLKIYSLIYSPPNYISEYSKWQFNLFTGYFIAFYSIAFQQIAKSTSIHFFHFYI
jgi:hypothetical protein